MKVVFLPIKGIVNFEITIITVNPGPSTCRNGERKGNLLLFSFNSGSDFPFPLFHTHSIPPYHIIPTCRIGSGHCVLERMPLWKLLGLVD